LYVDCVDDQASLFTGVLYGPLYGPPPGFRFEGIDPPIMVSNSRCKICLVFFVTVIAH